MKRVINLTVAVLAIWVLVGWTAASIHYAVDSGNLLLWLVVVAFLLLDTIAAFAVYGARHRQQ